MIVNMYINNELLYTLKVNIVNDLTDEEIVSRIFSSENSDEYLGKISKEIVELVIKSRSCLSIIVIGQGGRSIVNAAVAVLKEKLCDNADFRSIPTDHFDGLEGNLDNIRHNDDIKQVVILDSDFFSLKSQELLSYTIEKCSIDNITFISCFDSNKRILPRYASRSVLFE